MLIVPGRPARTGLTWWILSDTEGVPALTLSGPRSVAAQTSVRPLGLPGEDPVARRMFVVATMGLDPDSVYRLDGSAGGVSASATSRTLPAALPVGSKFTIALGSCYCVARDPGITAAYPPKMHDDSGGDPIRLRFLGGDQIYMDLSPSSASPIFVGAPRPLERYFEQWQRLAFTTFLRASPNLTLADDHEFWNDYPHGSAWLTWSEHDLGGPLGKKMDRAFSLFQAGLNLDPAVIAASAPGNMDNLLRGVGRTFSLDVGGIGFFVLDDRTYRNRFDSSAPQFSPASWLNGAVAWIRGLRGPGVLVVSQPLVEERNGAFARTFHTMGDVNLPDYDANFAALWEALFQAPHDVVVLTGDIHWSRAYRIRRGTGLGRMVWEVVSSPLARIPGSASGMGQSTGKVDWKGGTAGWTSDYTTNVASTYTTLTFAPASQGLHVHARAWQVPDQRGRDAALIKESEIDLH